MSLKNTTNQRGNISLLIIVLILVLLAAGGYFLFVNKNSGVLSSNASPNFNSQTATQPPLPYTAVKDKLTEKFPDFPIYPDSKIEESRKMNNALEGQKGYSATLEAPSGSTVIGISNWYKQELAKKGWETLPIDEASNNNIAEQVTKYKKGDQYALLIVEQGEGENPEDIEILINLPVDPL